MLGCGGRSSYILYSSSACLCHPSKGNLSYLKKEIYFYKESDVMLVYVSERLLLQHLTYKAQTLLVVHLQAFRSFGQERFTLGHHHWNCFIYSHGISRFLCTETDAWRSVSFFSFLRTKRLIIDVTRNQPGSTLIEILETPATEQQVHVFTCTILSAFHRCLYSSSPHQYSRLQSEFLQILQNYTLTQVP